MVSYDLGNEKVWDYQMQVNREAEERMNRIEDKLDKTNGKLNSLTILVIISLVINVVEIPSILPIVKSLVSLLIHV